MSDIDTKIYVWAERLFVSANAVYQKGNKPRLPVFTGVRNPSFMAALAVTPPRWCPIRVGYSIGAWDEMPPQEVRP